MPTQIGVAIIRKQSYHDYKILCFISMNQAYFLMKRDQTNDYFNFLLCHSQLSLIWVVFWNGVDCFCLLSWLKVWFGSKLNKEKFARPEFDKFEHHDFKGLYSFTQAQCGRQDLHKVEQEDLNNCHPVSESVKLRNIKLASRTLAIAI